TQLYRHQSAISEKDGGLEPRYSRWKRTPCAISICVFLYLQFSSCALLLPPRLRTSQPAEMRLPARPRLVRVLSSWKKLSTTSNDTRDWPRPSRLRSTPGGPPKECAPWGKFSPTSRWQITALRGRLGRRFQRATIPRLFRRFRTTSQGGASPGRVLRALSPGDPCVERCEC